MYFIFNFTKQGQHPLGLLRRRIHHSSIFHQKQSIYCRSHDAEGLGNSTIHNSVLMQSMSIGNIQIETISWKWSAVSGTVRCLQVIIGKIDLKSISFGTSSVSLVRTAGCLFYFLRLAFKYSTPTEAITFMFFTQPVIVPAGIRLDCFRRIKAQMLS